MKILSFISFFLFSAFSFAQSGNIEFSKVLHDFGTISEHGGTVAYDFIFKNTGDATISISSVKASCGCTVPVWTQSQVEPEEYGFVKITYHPEGRPGFFVKSIIVSASDGEAKFKRYLNIKGKVVSDNMEEVVGNFSYSENEDPDVSSKLINPYVQYFNSKNKKRAINEENYDGFIEKLVAAASRDGFINIRIEASSSKFPSKEKFTKYEIAQRRAGDAQAELLVSLQSKGIAKNQVGFQEPEIAVQGPEYDGKRENSKDYDLFEYVKIIAIDYNAENEAEALKEFLKDSEISTTVQVMPEDIETLEKISKEDLALSKKEELDAIKASAEVIAKARHKADSLIASLKAKAESGEENESKRLREQLKLQEEYVNLTRLEIQLLKEEMKVVKKSDSLSLQAIRDLQLELNARMKSEILAKQEIKEMQIEANTISLFENEIDTLSAQLRDKEEAEDIARLLIKELQVKLLVRETYDSIVQLKVAVLETEIKLRRKAGNAVHEEEALGKMKKEIALLRKQLQDAVIFANEMKTMTLAEIKAKEKLEKELEVMRHSGSGFAAKNQSNGHVVYKVQVAISEKPLDIKKKFKGYDEISEYLADGKYKYAIGNKPNLQAANELKDELRRAGYEYAFVVAFKNNQKIPLKDALKYNGN